ncbi:MAG: hypothetical protein KIG14_01130 [Candidatus Sacchiramonaceae bacterium]|nr:hypothetical protein [Candidatus Saccharimonadaceae bacterium]
MENVETGYTVGYVVNGQCRFVHAVRHHPEALKNPECSVALQNLAMIQELINGSYATINGMYEGRDLIFVTDKHEVLQLGKIFDNIEERAIERLAAAGFVVQRSETAISAITRCIEDGEITDDSLEIIAGLVVEYTSLFRLFMGVNPEKLQYTQAAVDRLGANTANSIRNVHAQPRSREKLLVSV